MRKRQSLEEAVAEYRRAWAGFFNAVAESLRIPAFVEWLDRKLRRRE